MCKEKKNSLEGVSCIKKMLGFNEEKKNLLMSLETLYIQFV